MGLPWFKFHTSDALDDPLSRTARLSNRHLGIWLRVHARLLNCKPPGSGYLTEGAPITDQMWAKMVHERARVWSEFAKVAVDELRLFGRDEAGTIFLENPSKSIPAQDNTAGERMRRKRERDAGLRRNEPVTSRNVTVAEPEPDTEPEPEREGEPPAPVATRATNPNAKMLGSMFCTTQRPRQDNAGRVAERFQVILDAGVVTVPELNAEIVRHERRKDEFAWEMVDRIAPREKPKELDGAELMQKAVDDGKVPGVSGRI